MWPWTRKKLGWADDVGEHFDSTCIACFYGATTTNRRRVLKGLATHSTPTPGCVRIFLYLFFISHFVELVSFLSLIAGPWPWCEPAAPDFPRASFG